MDPTAIDAGNLTLGGVLGSLALAAVQALWARFSPPKPPSPQPVPLPAPVPLPPDAQPVPPVPVPQPSGLAALLESLALSLLRARLSAGPVPPELKAAAPVLRRLLDEIDPPVPK